MGKFLKVVKTIAVLLIVILVSFISFFGIYVQNDGVWEDILPEYKTGMELGGYRELRFVLDDTEESKEVYVDENGNYKGDVLVSIDGVETTEETAETTTETTEVAEEAELDVVKGYTKKQVTEKVNPDEKINIETFEATKKMLQQRIEAQGSYEYNIRQDSVTGELIIEIPDDDNVSLISDLVTTKGEIQIIDSETGIILLDNSYVESAGVLTGELSEEEVEEIGVEETEEHDHSEIYHQVYLQLDFNAEGTEILKEISKNYLSTTDGTEANTISVQFDDQTLITTYFGEALETGSIQVPLGDPALPGEELYDITYRVARLAEIINTEELPLIYKLASDRYIKSEITDDVKFIFNIASAVIMLVVSLYMIIKYKVNGLKQAIISVGYVGAMLLIMRYVGVIFTYNSVIAFLAVVLINYVFSFKLLKKLKEEKNRKVALKETMKELYLAIVPVCIIACIFTFMSSVIISSIGNVLFWGLLVQVVFSIIALL